MALRGAALAYAVVLCLTFSAIMGGIVLAVSLVIAAALHCRCTTGSPMMSAVSSILAGLFLAYALVGVFSIAPFYLPAAAALSLAAVLTPTARPRRALLE